MNNKVDNLMKSLESVGNLVSKSIEESSKQASRLVSPTDIWSDLQYSMPEIEIPINPMVGIAEEQLLEIKKLNSQIETLQKRIDDLEDKAKQDSKNQWKHDILMAFIGAFFGFVFSLFV